MSMKDLMDVIPSPEKHVIDVVGVLTLGGVFAEILPHIAALLTIIWTALRIYETPTIQKLFNKEKRDDERTESD